MDLSDLSEVVVRKEDWLVSKEHCEDGLLFILGGINADSLGIVPL